MIDDLFDNDVYTKDRTNIADHMGEAILQPGTLVFPVTMTVRKFAIDLTTFSPIRAKYFEVNEIIPLREAVRVTHAFYLQNRDFGRFTNFDRKGELQRSFLYCPFSRVRGEILGVRCVGFLVVYDSLYPNLYPKI